MRVGVECHRLERRAWITHVLANPNGPDVDGLARFVDAWASHDVNGLLELMTDDAVYAASVGPEPGRTFRGHQELAAGFRTMFDHDAGADIEQGEPVVFGDMAVSTWAYHVASVNGSRRSDRGIDLWRF